MNQGWTRGCVAISIDTAGPQHLAARAPMAERLADQLTAAGLASTWAIAAHESAWGRVLTGQSQREWALRSNLGDGASAAPVDWSRGWDQARCHGWRGTTIALAGQPSAAWLAWAQRHQVTAVVPLADASHSSTASTWKTLWQRFRAAPVAFPSSLRWGIWSFPAHARCLDHQIRAWRRPLEALLQRGGLVHLTIELAWLANGGRPAWRTIDQLSRVCTRLRDAGLESATLGQLACQLNRRPAVAPARSILRPAA